MHECPSVVDIEVLIVCLICFFVESVCLDFVELFLCNHELWTHSIRITFVVLVLIEMPVHAAFAMYYVGVEAGFSLYVLIVILLIYMAAFYERRTRNILSALVSIIFLC